ncbi:MAG: hypothetical protein SGI90_13185 [Candidatus Eisenbacteria bacterium]|nr:hypothetical protein [Candidatus Eisenbacteria bacterium]
MTGSRLQLIRDLDAGYCLDLVLVSAVTAVLSIRFGLRLTGFPQVSLGEIHIAHMLWGGLLMLAAIVVLLSYIGRGGDEVAAVIGGLGFGTFIDEVGKFVTRDNDYFYRPSVAIIYVTFIIAWMAVRSIHRERTASKAEYLANAIMMLRKMATSPLTTEERLKALDYLKKSDPSHPAVVPLLRFVDSLPEARGVMPGILARTRVRLADGYRRLAGRPLFATAMTVFFVGQLVLKLLQAALFVGVDRLSPEVVAQIPFLQPELLDDRTRAEWGQLGSSLLSGIFVVLGALAIRKDRLGAFRMFQRSILVSIFLTQVFMFYQRQWGALAALAFNLLVFLALRFMIERERAARENSP